MTTYEIGDKVIVTARDTYRCGRTATIEDIDARYYASLALRFDDHPLTFRYQPNEVEHYDDTTEDAHVVRTGYVDPHEQTGSDAETLPLEAPTPISRRWNRWRMYRDEHGQWRALQPDNVDTPYFKHPDDGLHTYGIHHESGARVLHELQLALAKAAA